MTFWEMLDSTHYCICYNLNQSIETMSLDEKIEI